MTEVMDGLIQSNYMRPMVDSNIIKIRLDTKSLLNDIETFLRGYKEVIDKDDNGNLTLKKIDDGIPKMNDEGIRSVLNWINGHINPQCVQGNFYCDRHGFSEMFQNYLYEYRVSLITYIILNATDWELSDLELGGITDFIMLMVEPFMSRLLDNLERKSYGESLRTVDTSSSINSSKFNLFRNK